MLLVLHNNLGSDAVFVPAVRRFKARAPRMHFTARML
jgi:hypothetical protein